MTLFGISFLLPKKSASSYGTASFSKNSKLLRRKYKGFIIGNKKFSSNVSTQHLLLVAPSGSGKTSNMISKNVFHLLSKGHSMIITDPKLELWEQSSGWAQNKMDINVSVLNLLNPSKSITWNPLQTVANKNYQGLITDMYEITNSKNTSESIWKYGTIEILTALCKVLASVEDQVYLNLANLQYLLQYLQAYPKKTANWLKDQNVDDLTSLSITRFLNQDEKIFHGILSGAISVIVPFIPDEIKALTHTTSLPTACEMRKNQSVLFLALPIGKESTYSPYVSLLLTYVFGQIMNTPVQGNDRYIVGIMEEFGQVFIPNYASIISTVRSRKMMLLHCLQNIDQLTLRYGEQTAQIIANNCSHWLLLSSIKSDATLTYVRDSLLGTMTNTKDNNQENSRYLLTKDEIRRIPKNSGLLISDNLQPVMVSMKPLFKSYFLMWLYGLKSNNNQLVSIYPPLSHTDSIHDVKYIPISEHKKSDTSSENNELDVSTLSFREQLKKILPTDNNDS